MNKEQLFNQLKKEISKTPAVVYWDNATIDKDILIKAKKEYPENPIDYFTSESFIGYDYIYDLERNVVKEVVNNNISDICETLSGYEEEDFDVDDFVNDYWQELYTHVQIDYNLKSLLSGTLNIVVAMHSNYDCINSHWFEASNGYSLKEYFGDVVKTLGLNRKNIGKLLTDHSIKKIGPGWINNKSKELVSYKEFWEEEENRSSPACLLVFVGQVNIYDYLTKKFNKVIIPKGNTCGYYSHWEGGGSLIGMELLHDFKIQLDEEFKDGRKFSLFIDGERGYSIKEVYGAYDSFFGEEITLL